MTHSRPLRNINATILLAVVAAQLFSGYASATTLVAMIDRKHHRVVLASDSLLRQTRSGNTSQVCKIVAHPGCAFMMAGLLDKEFPVFHLQDFGDQACSLSGDLQHRADAFLNIVRDSVTEVANYLRRNEPQFYADNLNRNGGEFVTVIFAGIQNGKPVIFRRGYKLTADGGVAPISSDLTEDNNGLATFAGFNQDVASYINTNHKWQKMDRVALARKFVQLEIDSHPDWVGPPVAVLTIDHLDQQKWIDPGTCLQQPAPEKPPSPQPGAEPQEKPPGTR